MPIKIPEEDLIYHEYNILEFISLNVIKAMRKDVEFIKSIKKAIETNPAKNDSIATNQSAY